MTEIKAHLMEKNIATNCSQVTVPVLAGWTKKPFGHYAILKLFSLRSPSKSVMKADLKRTRHKEYSLSNLSDKIYSTFVNSTVTG